MDQNWQEVFSTSHTWQAEMAKQILEENEIPAVVINRKDSSYLFGEVSVYTEPEHAERAKELLKDIQG
ncbi:putative signal transducing protein [Tenuifilum osseticum]|uniref:putative signal transducing protein n=1 Tax=Tenuifilum osseticum TaxID=3374723 RepID=UPI0034E465FD